MRVISPSKVIIKNFRSLINVTVDFPSSIGLLFLGGDNVTDVRLGANGAGKSSFWNAIHWCKYGTGIKSERTSDLLSWGMEQIEVELHLLIDNKTSIIRRTGPPDRLSLDGQPATQSQINELLGLTKERYCHSIMFGQDKDLFPDLPVSERGLLLDQVLNLDIWNNCSEQASIKSGVLQEQVADCKVALSRIEGQLSQLQTEEQIQAKIDEWETVKRIDLKQLATQLHDWFLENAAKQIEYQKQSDNWVKEKGEELEVKAGELEKLEIELEGLLAIQQKLSLATNLVEADGIVSAKLKADKSEYDTVKQRYYQLEAERKQVVAPKLFWNDNKTCPTCGQHISDAKKHNHLIEIDKREAAILADIFLLEERKEQLQLAIEAHQTEIKRIDCLAREEQTLVRDNEKDIKNARYRISQLEYDAERILKDVESNNNPFAKQIEYLKQTVPSYIDQIEVLKKKKNPFTSLLDKAKTDRLEIEQQKQEKQNSLEELKRQLVAVDFWKTGFKRIRLFFIQQILLALQLEIKTCINALGLSDWTVKLATESETKSGTIKLGIAITVKSPLQEAKFEVWSGGETQRLRLGIALGLAALIQRAAGVKWNFLVLDEPTQYLSSEGIEDLLEALQQKSETHRQQIWICDHHALQFSGFQEIWMAKKEVTGTCIYNISKG